MWGNFRGRDSAAVDVCCKPNSDLTRTHSYTKETFLLISSMLGASWWQLECVADAAKLWLLQCNCNWLQALAAFPSTLELRKTLFSWFSLFHLNLIKLSNISRTLKKRWFLRRLNIEEYRKSVTEALFRIYMSLDVTYGVTWPAAMAHYVWTKEEMEDFYK